MKRRSGRSGCRLSGGSTSGNENLLRPDFRIVAKWRKEELEASRSGQCEFSLVRYVPDTVKNEFVNIGVVLREAGPREAAVRFTRDWRRVRCVDRKRIRRCWRRWKGDGRRLADGCAGGEMGSRRRLSNAVQMTEVESLPGGVVPDGDGELMADVYRDREAKARGAAAERVGRRLRRPCED